MDRIQEVKGRKLIVNNLQIKVDDLVFTPGQTDRITGLLGTAGSMATLKGLPPSIADPPVIISFSEDGNHFLSIEDGSNLAPYVKFKFEGIGDLITAIQTGLEIAIDMQKIQPKILPSGSLIQEQGDIIEGRE